MEAYAARECVDYYDAEMDFMQPSRRKLIDDTAEHASG
jgi:hypothetical protein